MKKLLFLFYLIFILVFTFENNSAQRLLKISVSKNNQDAHISYIVRKGITYISTKDLSKILSGNYYYNPTAAKIEMKFDNYNLKITARNQFLVLTSKNKRDTKVFQIPISTLLIKNDVFIPAIYALDYVEIAYQKELLFDDKAKHLTITNNSVEIFDKIRRVETKDIYVKTIPRDSKESDYDIYGIEISEMTNGTLIRLNTTRPINKFSSSIHDGTLYLFVTGASFEPDILENVNTAGVVKSLSMKDVKGNRQIEFKLTGGTAIADSMHESSKDIDTDDILITIHNEVFSGMTKNIIENKNHWIFDVIVIDAGHGGKDPGAIGITGAREKDIN
ncbi:MAG: N-acetylmuramoyl-L-alanine amidase, partial [Melioribacteraceae bacterium]|nr:N-acetylmuramoyl-L-alanine amidase [Melioribacteraceae bacterium]